jgi:hypothetical protein
LLEPAFQHSALLVDRAHDLGVLALGVGLQCIGLLLSLPQLRFGPGLRVRQQRVGTLAGLGDRGLGLATGVADDLVGVGPCVGQQLVGLGLSLAGKTVGGVLREAEHAGGPDGLLLAQLRRRHRRCDRRGLRRLDRLGLGLVDRNRLGGLRTRAGAGTGAGQLLVQFGDALTQIGVLLDEASQLVLDQIEEGVDLVLVVTTLADRRLAERHIVDVCGCQRHS